MTRRTDDTGWLDVQDAALFIARANPQVHEAVRQLVAGASAELSRFQCRRRSGRWEVRTQPPFLDIGAVLRDRGASQ